MPSLSSAMGWYWLGMPLLVVALGGLLLLRGGWHLFARRPGKAATRAGFGAVLACAGVAASLVAFNTQSFNRLTYEGPVADVRVQAVDPAQRLYRVTVVRLDGPQMAGTCQLQGDEWVMSARVQTWKPWANVLGLDATYALDQLGNKYFDAREADGRPITACDLRGPPPAVNAYVPRSWLLWLIDRSYTENRRFGSAVYMPLANGADYRVVMTQSGLNAEPANAAAAAVNDKRP